MSQTESVTTATAKRRIEAAGFKFSKYDHPETGEAQWFCQDAEETSPELFVAHRRTQGECVWAAAAELGGV